MRLHLLSVGKPSDTHCGNLVERYLERIRRLGVAVEVAWVPETPAGGRYSKAHAQEREARALRERIPAKARRLALDPAGRALSSPQWGERVERWLRPVGCVIVGGPLGLDQELVAEADEQISLGPITLPHELARVVASEQLYRGLTLARGIPYHK